MIVRKSASGEYPAEELRGPTLVLCRYNIVAVTKDDFTGYEYDEDAYEIGEYDMLYAGYWTGVFTVAGRRIERKGKHDYADAMISKCKDNGSTEESNDVKAWRSYKRDCRLTVNQESFPEKCVYPNEPKAIE